jgi:hypothetical protein
MDVGQNKVGGTTMSVLFKAGAMAAARHQAKRNEQASQDDMQQQLLMNSVGGGAGGEMVARHMSNVETQKTKRLRMKLGCGCIGPLVVAAGVFAAYRIGDWGFGVQEQQITTQEVTTALTNVQLTQNGEILVTTGHSGVDTRTNAAINVELGPIKGGVGVPGSNEETGADITSDLDFMTSAGSITLRGIQGPNGWETLATINENMITVQRANETDTVTYGQQILPNAGNAIGIPSNVAQRIDTDISEAQTNFEASCAPIVNKPSVISEAEAGYIHYVIGLAEEDTQSVSAVSRGILKELNDGPIIEQFVNAPAGSTQIYSSDFVPASQVSVSLPEPIKSGSTNHGTDNTDVLGGGQCWETQEFVKKLAKIMSGKDYIDISAPMDLARPPYNPSQISHAERA